MLVSYMAASLWFTWPFLASGANLGVDDWDAILFHHAAVLKTVYEYGQLPFWGPWYCGGDVLWQNPQVPLVTSTYAFALVMPVAAAMKVTVLLHYAVGFVGMHYLVCRVMKRKWLPAAVFFSSLFTLAGAPAFHLAAGHGTFLPYFYLPWAILCLISSIDTGRLSLAAGVAAIIALMIYAGGVIVAIMTSVGVGCFCMAAALTRRDWRPLAILGVIGALALLFAAPKLVPMAAFVSDPRLVPGRAFPLLPDVMRPAMVEHAFLDPYQFRRMGFPGQLYGWHEYGNYIGSLGVLSIASSFIWLAMSGPFSRSKWMGVSLAATAIALFAVMIGDLGPYAPYRLLRRLPLLSEFRLPSRYTLVFLAFAVPMAAWVTGAVVADHDLPPALRRLTATLLILAAMGLGLRTRVQMVGVFPLSPLDSTFRLLSRPGAPSIDADAEAFGPDSPMLRALGANRAVANCNEPLRLPGAIRPERPVVFSDDPVTISQIVFTPNRIQFGAVSPWPARVFLNQRYVRGWTSSVGSLSLDAETGLAYVSVPADTATRIDVTFTPPGIVSGVVLFVGGIVAAAALWRRRLGPAQTSAGPSLV